MGNLFRCGRGEDEEITQQVGQGRAEDRREVRTAGRDAALTFVRKHSRLENGGRGAGEEEERMSCG